MPLYEFTCEKCGYTFSELRKMGDYDGVRCPECGSLDTRKLMSTFASSPPNSSGCSGCLPSGGG